MFIEITFLIIVVCILLRKFLSTFTLGNPSQRYVLVTGCDRGFGKLLVLRLLSQNIPVFATCLTKEGDADLQTKAKNGELRGRLEVIPMNVTSADSIQFAVQYITSQLQGRGLWALVNNAGVVGATGPDDWMNPDDYRKVLEVNTLGTISVTQAFKPLLKQRRGRIVTMISVAGRVGLPYHGPYSVSKYAMEAYCDIQRTELKPFGVSVHILDPGFFETDLISGQSLGELFDKTWINADARAKDDYGLTYLQDIKDNTEGVLQRLRSKDLNKVINAYQHAITATFPHLRYYPGWDTFLFIPYSVLPTRLQDWIIDLLFYLANVPKPAATVNPTKSSECKGSLYEVQERISIFGNEMRLHRRG